MKIDVKENEIRGLEEAVYTQLQQTLKCNGIAVRITAYHGDTKKYDIQIENPYQVYVKHFGHLTAEEIDEKSIKDIEKY